MKLCFVFSLVLCVGMVLGLKSLDLSWTLSLVGGLLAISGAGIFLLGCNMQRLLSNEKQAESHKGLLADSLKRILVGKK
ncbi:hypothetical protein [Limnobacter parvus]|uniref:Uncharacterized protein n=1 Tax=Limnobacter parvus TaxID=2939690 RepID=A0ABT1XLF5_9BURK|nr:hypothetical protein [Limnobacter parvus]MCR2747714.1 hypothetical protein [Limnobacter parvus]